MEKPLLVIKIVNTFNIFQNLNNNSYYCLNLNNKQYYLDHLPYLKPYPVTTPPPVNLSLFY